MMKDVLKIITVFLVGLCVGSLILFMKKKAEPIVQVIKEIVYVDTNRIPEPVFIPELTIIEDYVLIENPDLSARDTLPTVQLKKETKTYKDSTYMAIVSGYNPSLDYIETYNRTKYITIEKKPRKWLISALTGASFMGTGGSAYCAGQIGYYNKGWGLSGQFGRDFTAKQNFVGVEISRDIIWW